MLILVYLGVKIMDVASKELVAVGSSIHSAPVSNIFWAPDERQILTGAGDSCLCVWNFFL